jgi:Icc-related predicted phosphoesterase
VRDFGCPLDLILYAGDDIARFRPDPKTNYFEQLARLTKYGLCAVAGNDDVPKHRELIKGRRVFNVHRTPVVLGDYLIAGLEGAPDRPEENIGIGYLLHSEQAIAAHLAAMKRLAADRRILLVSHAPPYGCLDTAQRFGVRNIGSTALASWLEQSRKEGVEVAAVVCGHVHRCGGQELEYAGTVVVNVASHDNLGEPLRIARIHDNPGWGPDPAIVICGLASEHDELMRVDGIGPGLAVRLGNAGVKTVADLAATAPETVGRALGWRPTRAAVFPARATALVQRRPVVLGPLHLPAGPRLFFDIETDPNPPTFVWLVGCFLPDAGRVEQFLASRPGYERRMLLRFTRFAATLGDRVWMYFSQSGFDRRILLERLRHHQLEVPQALESSLDIQPLLRAAVAPPAHSFALKDVAKTFGYRFQHPGLDGLAVAAEYLTSVRLRRVIPKRLLEYNCDDLLSLRRVVEEVEALSTPEASNQIALGQLDTH